MSRFDRMLATILCKRNVMNEDQRESLVEECEGLGQPLPDLLLSKGVCREPDLIAAVADELSCHPILLENVTPSPEALELLTGQQCLENEVLPISRLANTLTLAVANPFDEPRLDQIRTATGCEVIPVLSTSPSLRSKLHACFPDLNAPAAETTDQETVDAAADAPINAPAHASVSGEMRASWMNLAQELEKDAEQPEAPADGTPGEQTDDAAQDQADDEQGFVVTEEEVQVDVPDVTSQETETADQETAPDLEDKTPVDMEVITEEEATPTLPEGEIQVEAAEEVVPSETEQPSTIETETPETQPEADVQVDAQVDAEAQAEATPEPPPQPAVDDVPEATSTIVSEQSWDEVVEQASARSAQVSWWRAAEAGVPAADEQLEGEDAQALEVARALLLDAFERGFEELVLDAADDGLHVLERTARVHQPLTTAPRHLQQPLLSRLKWMAGLPLNRRRAQTGSFMAAARGHEYVCRLHALPTIHGERLQIELLHSEIFSTDLAGLGITGSGADDFRWAVANPAGLLLLAAPPGHGREPAMRALLGLSRPNDEQAVTLEDPVLVRLPGVAQVPVGHASGLTTVKALRTALRRAPERLLVANIHDAEATRLAVQAAASGTLVLAGMNAPDVFSALARLTECGVPPFALASALRLAASQRGLRQLCEECRESVPVDRDRLLAAGCREDELGNAALHRPVGCSACHRGYLGHLTVYETLRITGELRRLVSSGAPVPEWRNKTLEWGFLTLRRTALPLALRGETSLEEVLIGTPEDV